MTPPVVSICVPTYNGEAYLVEALDSLLAQTFTDFEVVIVDDCSTDGTVSVAERYAARDKRVRVLRNERNLGLVGNWNRCIELSRGDWIKFVFQDDLIASRCVERLLDAARGGARLVSCARDFLFEPGASDIERGYLLRHKDLLASLFSQSSEITAERFSELTLDHPDVNLLGEPTVVMLHRTLFERFGSFNKFMIQVVDGEYWARVGTAIGAAHVDETLATFRVHAASTTSLNRSTREVRKRLDALIVRHEHAFSPSYAALRSVARARRPERDLADEFWRTTYSTLVEHGVADTLLGAGGRTGEETRAIFATYPRMRRVPLRYAVAAWTDRVKNFALARIRRPARRVQ